MQEFILYVDDTGFNAKEKDSELLKSEQATYAGVLIHKDLAPEFERIMKHMGSLLKQRFGTEEFHFTEMYNHKKAFEGIEIDETRDILSMFADLFNEFELPIVVHTIQKEVNEHQNVLYAMIDEIAPKYHLPKGAKTQALMLVCFRAKQYLEENFTDAKLTKVVCDEGLRKNGAEETIQPAGIKLQFRSSEQSSLLQLADFSAWFITRAKHILDKLSKNKEISEIDRAILEIYSKLAENYVNLSQVEIDLDDSKDFDYDQAHRDLTD